MNPADSLDLRDIQAAALPEFWPPAPGWWLLAGLLLVALVLLGRYLLKQRRQRRLRRRLYAELDALDGHSPAEVATGVSMLLRRVALMRYERNQVASLTGRDWLAFLDARGGNGEFVDGVGTVLATAPYAAHDLTNANSAALIDLARQWIKRNLGAAT